MGCVGFENLTFQGIEFLGAEVVVPEKVQDQFPGGIIKELAQQLQGGLAGGRSRRKGLTAAEWGAMVLSGERERKWGF